MSSKGILSMSTPLRTFLLIVAAFLLLPASARAGACTSGPSTLCLQGDRFQVTVDWVDGGDSGQGIVLPLVASNFGFFRYSDPQAAEVMARVSDACVLNSHFWVQLAVLSDFEQTVTVTDLNLGTQQQYVFAAGSYGQPVIDLGSFPCSAPFDPPPAAGPTRGQELLLFDGRFRAEVVWQDGGGQQGSGQPTTILDRAGYFTFIAPANPELVVKMTPGAGSGFYTVVASAVSTLQYELTITDLCSGDVQVYNQPLNNTLTIADEQAFPAECPVIFQDDFESGGLLGWSSVVGEA